jgi:sensor c-di-GMP phosphodiesterase-like protein
MVSSWKLTFEFLCDFSQLMDNFGTFRASLFEEYKENFSLFTQQINEKKNLIHQLKQANLTNENNTHDEQRNLETRLFNLKKKLENEREKLKSIDKMLSAKTSEGSNQSLSKTSVCESPSFDRNSNIMSKSFNENMFFNRGKIEISHIDFNCNVDENEKVFTSSTPKNQSRPSSTVVRKDQHSNVATSSLNASPLTMPKFNTMMSSSSTNYHNSYKTLPYAKSIAIANGTSTKDSVVARQTTNKATKQKRPLTRYLPNFSLDFDLKKHIETAGHQIQLCPHIILDGKF